MTQKGQMTQKETSLMCHGGKNMAKAKTIFVCSSCGYESAKWLGKCPACNEWNTFYEEKIMRKCISKCYS